MAFLGFHIGRLEFQILDHRGVLFPALSSLSPAERAAVAFVLSPDWAELSAIGASIDFVKARQVCDALIQSISAAIPTRSLTPPDAANGVQGPDSQFLGTLKDEFAKLVIAAQTMLHTKPVSSSTTALRGPDVPILHIAPLPPSDQLPVLRDLILGEFADLVGHQARKRRGDDADGGGGPGPRITKNVVMTPAELSSFEDVIKVAHSLVAKVGEQVTYCATMEHELRAVIKIGQQQCRLMSTIFAFIVRDEDAMARLLPEVRDTVARVVATSPATATGSDSTYIRDLVQKLSQFSIAD